MPLLPWLGQTGGTDSWSDQETLTFVIVSYCVVATYLATLALTIVNFAQFVVTCKKKVGQEEQKCRARQPLLIFYLLASFCLFTNISFSILIVQMETNYAPYIRYLPATWKVLLGIDQVWLLIEFCIHMRRYVAKMNSRLDVRGSQTPVTICDEIKTQRQLTFGRLLVTLSILLMAITMLIILATKVNEDRTQQEQQYSAFAIFFTTMFVLLSAGLLTAAIFLRQILGERNRLLEPSITLVQLEQMRYEKCRVFSVILILSLSFFLSAIYQFARSCINADSFQSYMFATLNRLPLDILPVSFILMLHRWHLASSDKQNEKTAEGDNDDMSSKLVFISSPVPENSSIGTSASLRQGSVDTGFQDHTGFADSFQNMEVYSNAEMQTVEDEFVTEVMSEDPDDQFALLSVLPDQLRDYGMLSQ